MKILPILVLCSLVLLAACVKQSESNQSIQDIVSQTPDFEENETQVPQTQPNQTAPRVINATKAPSVDIIDEIPNIYRKCRYSVILYGGCKWTDGKNTSFTLSLLSASKRTIPGFWFFITGESGNKTVKRAESVLSGGRKTFTIDYEALVKEIGKVTRFGVLPIEIINDTEFACFNQQSAPFIPETHCKPSEPVKVN